MDLIVYADIYHTAAFKTLPNLREPISDQVYLLRCHFSHKRAVHVQSGSIELKKTAYCIVTAKPRTGNIDFFFCIKLDSPIPGQYVRDTAELDEVRCIEKVAKLVIMQLQGSCDNGSRQVLKG